MGRGEHWGGFGDSPGCLGALKESTGEHLEEPWRLYGMSWEAKGSCLFKSLVEALWDVLGGSGEAKGSFLFKSLVEMFGFHCFFPS